MDIHVGFCQSQNPNSLVDKQPRNYLALFTKGSFDGQPRNERVLNAVVILDISGSMNGRLSGKSSNEKSILYLSKEAIKMFVSKLRDTDSFGLEVFDSNAKTIIPSQRKDKLDLNALFALEDTIKASGGNTLNAGFDKGEECLR
jgi:hypothetical protein